MNACHRDRLGEPVASSHARLGLLRSQRPSLAERTLPRPWPQHRGDASQGAVVKVPSTELISHGVAVDLVSRCIPCRRPTSGVVMVREMPPVMVQQPRPERTDSARPRRVP